MSSQSIDTIYCHGLPGSAQEINSLVPEGFPVETIPPLGINDFDQATPDFSPEGVHIIGFSLGAMTAIKIAAQRPQHVRRLSLIAPAAPLELGDFLPGMAGKAVFKTAMKSQLTFKVFTLSQRIGVGIAPAVILRAMFAGSPKADLDLLSDPIFKPSMIAGLRRSFGTESAAYREAVHTYVQPWAEDLQHIACPVDIHHGELDNWAPVEMAHALKSRIQADVTVQIHAGLGHYSTLYRVLPAILDF